MKFVIIRLNEKWYTVDLYFDCNECQDTQVNTDGE